MDELHDTNPDVDGGDTAPIAQDAPPEAPVPATPVPAVAPAAPEHKNGSSLIIACIIFSIIAGGGAGLLAYRYAPDMDRSVRPSDAAPLSATSKEPAVAASAAALPSVVNIDFSGTEATGLPSSHPTVDVQGSGSGVAFRSTKDGGTYILTNDHVVAEAKSIKVTASTGESYTAKLVGTDPETDIAVISVKAKLPLTTMGDSDGLLVGQSVFAIGSPFGLQDSLSGGLVSAMHRSLPDSISNGNQYPLVDVIQTDAAINPGNSGGALVDRNGKLVGIPTAIFSETGGAEGVGFAIPSKTAVRIAEALITNGKADHPYLGVMGQTVTSALATEKKLSVTEGAYVVEVSKGTGAAKAGVKSGDVIVGLEDTTIRSMDDLLLAVKRHMVGDTVKLTVSRAGKKTTLNMTVGIKPEQ